MSDAWGTSWGTSWSSSWGGSTTVTLPLVTGTLDYPWSQVSTIDMSYAQGKTLDYPWSVGSSLNL